MCHISIEEIVGNILEISMLKGLNSNKCLLINHIKKFHTDFLLRGLVPAIY